MHKYTFKCKFIFIRDAQIENTQLKYLIEKIVLHVIILSPTLVSYYKKLIIHLELTNLLSISICIKFNMY